MITANAPGRAKWLGNHTDYNDGLVLGIGLEVGATVTVQPAGDRQLVLRATDLDEARICELDALSPIETGSWANYAIGVAAGFLSRGAKAQGLELEIRSTVPMGAGLSSSAALECATARALQRAWATNFDDMDLAQIGQEAEHKFAGVRCGLLDQVTSLFATRDHAVFFDCRSLEVERVPVPPEARFVIVQSGVKQLWCAGSHGFEGGEVTQVAVNEEVKSLSRRSVDDAGSVACLPGSDSGVSSTIIAHASRISQPFRAQQSLELSRWRFALAAPARPAFVALCSALLAGNAFAGKIRTEILNTDCPVPHPAFLLIRPVLPRRARLI